MWIKNIQRHLKLCDPLTRAILSALVASWTIRCYMNVVLIESNEGNLEALTPAMENNH